MDFKIMNEKVWFSDEFIKLNKLRNEFLKKAFNSVDEVIEKYKQTFISDEKTFDEVENFGEETLQKYLSEAINILKEYGVDNIDSESFLERYYCEKHYNIPNIFNEEEKKYSPYELNIKSDLVCSSINTKLSSVIFESSEDNKTLYKLVYSIAESVFNIHFAIIDALYDNGVKIVARYSDTSDIEKTNVLFENIVSKEDKKTILGLKELIEINPYNEELYKFLLQKYGDEKNEIESLGEFLGYNNIKAYKETLIKIDNEEEVKSKKRKKNIKITMFSIGGLIAVYLCITLFFINNFQFGTIINGVNAVAKSAEVMQGEVMAEAENYILEIQGRDGSKEEIKGTDIDLRYDFHSKIKDIKDSQNPFLWFMGLFKEKEYSISEGVIYDENLLRKIVDNFSYFDENNITQPENARIEYSNNNYNIVEEVKGNLVNREELYEGIINAINNIETKIDLEEADFYINPKYTSESKEVVEAKDNLNKYISSVITYDSNGATQQLDGSKISNWLEVDEDFNVNFDEGQVKQYVNTLGNTYDNLGNYREFMKPNGEILKVSTSSNISYIDRAVETQELINLIKEGKATTKEPIYAYVADSNLNSYVVNTFVEIDLTNQRIWYYKDGVLITQGDIVTGDVSRNYATPPGVFGLSYKQRNATLRGPGYSTPVNFWMPFNGDIGLHDATWRGAFGESIYVNNGSHGCVNLPYNVAQAIFNSIEDGNIIICRY